jgi:hypothetical protein
VWRCLCDGFGEANRSAGGRCKTRGTGAGSEGAVFWVVRSKGFPLFCVTFMALHRGGRKRSFIIGVNSTLVFGGSRPPCGATGPLHVADTKPVLSECHAVSDKTKTLVWIALKVGSDYDPLNSAKRAATCPAGVERARPVARKAASRNGNEASNLHKKETKNRGTRTTASYAFADPHHRISLSRSDIFGDPKKDALDEHRSNNALKDLVDFVR